MPARIAGSAVRTCLGDGPATFAALLRGEDGVAPLRHQDHAAVGVTHGYEIDDDRPEAFHGSHWLTACLRDALAQSGVDPARQRTVALIGTGLRELSAVEDGSAFATERLHFAHAVRQAAPQTEAVHTLAGACSAGGHALALAQDLIELGEADAVLVGGADAMTVSMLAMIGRVADRPADRVRPFDAERRGVLLGDGAAALVLVPDRGEGPGTARVLATGLSCDAVHPTAPDREGILRAMRQAFERAGRAPGEVDVVYAHGTGTALNDPVEAAALRELHGSPGPLVTAVKGAVGHTSGGSALLSVAMAVHSMEMGLVPPVTGLRDPLPEADGLRLVRGAPHAADVVTAQVDAFGFGGVNAVSLLERLA
ncbi:beta-ketoacyl synthase N-terminal-like domain-containing protein [Nonomuraea sp. NPDC046802]|uniref:beta-ketoacyl synthase N-terminal-like domain-containing protein n=1 Tax=Nonomuraea sp. NPDC046802 TaxID=3154919 RepID=UPI0033F922A2